MNLLVVSMITKSTTHRPVYHKDGDKTIWYCVICGQAEDELTQDCPGLVPRYQVKNFSNFFCGND